MAPGLERDYFAGILATRSGRADESIQLLSRALPQLRETQPERAATALEALADAYSMSYRYREAAQAYDDLEQHFARHLNHDVADDAALARILIDSPAQTIRMDGSVRLRTSRNPIGSLESELTVNGIREQWLLDTGANQSVVTRSFAERLGLTPLPGVASVGSGITGLKSPLRAALVPTLHLGGATVSNVVVLILDDANLRVGNGTDSYQINAILGYPVLKALSRITFTNDGEFLAGDNADKAGGTKMFMRGLTPAIECDVDGERLLFTFDTGASSTSFSVRYHDLFQGRQRDWRTETVESGGAGGSAKRTMFIEPAVTLGVSGKTVTLQNVSIFSTRMNAGIDVLFGNLGQDFVASFDRFTLDFVNMTFSLGSPLSSRVAVASERPAHAQLNPAHRVGGADHPERRRRRA
jgi:predicted aspartyl protease